MMTTRLLLVFALLLAACILSKSDAQRGKKDSPAQHLVEDSQPESRFTMKKKCIEDHDDLDEEDDEDDDDEGKGGHDEEDEEEEEYYYIHCSQQMNEDIVQTPAPITPPKFELGQSTPESVHRPSPLPTPAPTGPTASPTQPTAVLDAASLAAACVVASEGGVYRTDTYIYINFVYELLTYSDRKAWPLRDIMESFDQLVQDHLVEQLLDCSSQRRHLRSLLTLGVGPGLTNGMAAGSCQALSPMDSSHQCFLLQDSLNVYLSKGSFWSREQTEHVLGLLQTAFNGPRRSLQEGGGLADPDKGILGLHFRYGIIGTDTWTPSDKTAVGDAPGGHVPVGDTPIGDAPVDAATAVTNDGSSISVTMIAITASACVGFVALVVLTAAFLKLQKGSRPKGMFKLDDDDKDTLSTFNLAPVYTGDTDVESDSDRALSPIQEVSNETSVLDGKQDNALLSTSNISLCESAFQQSIQFAIPAPKQEARKYVFADTVDL